MVFIIVKYLTMQMPQLHGTCDQSGFFIYTACDTDYFDQFGRGIVRSIQQNSDAGIHLHLYNPRPDQLEFCRAQPRVSVTYELVSADQFGVFAQRWAVEPRAEPQASQYRRTLNAMSKGNDVDIRHRMQKTYYACARFIRLAKILQVGTQVLAIDSDAIVKNRIPHLPADQDLYIHYIAKKDPRFLAGGIYLTGRAQSTQFIQQYASALLETIDLDCLYWGIDQDLLNKIVPRYQHGQLPMEYIDWSMNPASYIWTAKGKRKDLAVFVNELKKYNF